MARSASVAIIPVGDCCEDFTKRRSRTLPGGFDIGVAFVSRSNPHSLDAHIGGLGMTEVGDFELMGNVYVILAFRLPAQSSS